MKKRTCFEITLAGYPIRLEQMNSGFMVTYGAQVAPFLEYGEAAKELGCSIMHALACEGKLDNE